MGFGCAAPHHHTKKKGKNQPDCLHPTGRISLSHLELGDSLPASEAMKAQGWTCHALRGRLDSALLCGVNKLWIGQDDFKQNSGMVS